MAHKWKDIRRKLSPEQEEETRRYVQAVVESVTLNQLREARKLTQASLASLLGVNQGSVSKMEKRTDMYISTLRSFIQAMGGELQIRAVFPEGEVGGLHGDLISGSSICVSSTGPGAQLCLSLPCLRWPSALGQTRPSSAW
jgi:DNA-binding XRE family transcriptional regulator